MAIILPENEKKLASSTMPENKEVDNKSSDPMAVAIEKAKPIIAKASFGSVVGYCSGYTIKQLGKMAAVVLGAGFILVQTCASYGYIQVDWVKVKGDAIKKVDTDGDGEFGAEELKVYWGKLKSLLTTNMANTGGFSLGFLYGLQA